MLKRIVQQVNGLIMAQFITVYSLVKAQLLLLVSKLRVSITQAYQNVVSLLHRLPQLVLTMLSSNPLVVGLTKAVQSIKAALFSVKFSLIQIGSQLQIIVQTIRQLVATLLSQKKEHPVAQTKSVQSPTKESKTVQTPTAALLTQDGLKSQGHAKPHQQRAKQQRKAKR